MNNLNSMGIVILGLFVILSLTGTRDSRDAQHTVHESRYTKLDATGQSLSESAAKWTMVRDNSTGLTWEAKTTDGGMHDKNKTFAWEDIEEKFIIELNEKKFGGNADWRLPDVQELASIKEKDKRNKVDQNFFPDTMPAKYWTFTSCCDGKPIACKLSFGTEEKVDRHYFVRAVRGALQPAGMDNAVNPVEIASLFH